MDRAIEPVITKLPTTKTLAQMASLFISTKYSNKVLTQMFYKLLQKAKW